MAAPNYRYAKCCGTCRHFEPDYEAYGVCSLHLDEDDPLSGPFEMMCDDHEMGSDYVQSNGGSHD